MRIISNKRGYILTDVIPEQVQYGLGPRGQTERTVIKPALHLHFRPFDLSRKLELKAAGEFWNGGPLRDTNDPVGYEAWGAHPSTISIPVQTHEGRQLTHPWSWVDNLSVFDTEWLPPDQKAEVEAFFRSGKFHSGGDCFVYEAPRLVAPWPSYDKIGQGAAAKIPALTRDLGIDPRRVYEYEAENKNRDGVLEGLAKLIAEDAGEAEVDAALTRQL